MRELMAMKEEKKAEMTQRGYIEHSVVSSSLMHPQHISNNWRQHPYPQHQQNLHFHQDISTQSYPSSHYHSTPSTHSSHSHRDTSMHPNEQDLKILRDELSRVRHQLAAFKADVQRTIPCDAIDRYESRIQGLTIERDKLVRDNQAMHMQNDQLIKEVKSLQIRSNQHSSAMYQAGATQRNQLQQISTMASEIEELRTELSRVNKIEYR